MKYEYRTVYLYINEKNPDDDLGVIKVSMIELRVASYKGTGSYFPVIICISMCKTFL